MPETKPPPQIPWTKEVVVTKEWEAVGRIYGYGGSGKGVTRVFLERPEHRIKAEIGSEGYLEVEVDSRDIARRTLSKDINLTRRFRKYYKATGESSFVENAMDWVKGEPTGDPVPPWGIGPPGVLDWSPEHHPPKWPKIGKIASSGIGSDISGEGWIGTRFSYVHFRMPDGDEGIVVDWTEGPPEVWTGDIDGFFSMNNEDFSDWNTYENYNDTFENGLLWALDRMDLFESQGIPEWAVKVIANNPELLWPEVVEKLLPRGEALPEKLWLAVGQWVDKRREEREKATGQSYLWPQKKLKHPTLAYLMGLGYIEVKEGEYVGKTPDGVEVNLGTVGYEDQLERYLFNRPEPEMW
jgi:hypothetical protein